jgi:CBS domain-containing protein
MTRAVLTVTETTALDEVVELMEGRHVKRIPVIKNGRLIGVVSRTDLLRALVQELGKTAPAAPADLMIQEQLVAELRRQAWGMRHKVTVIVTEGLVYLEGVVYDEREHEAIRVAAENVAGVKEVRDHLNNFDPNVDITGFGY